MDWRPRWCSACNVTSRSHLGRIYGVLMTRQSFFIADVHVLRFPECRPWLLPASILRRSREPIISKWSHRVHQVARQLNRKPTSRTHLESKQGYPVRACRGLRLIDKFPLLKIAGVLALTVGRALCAQESQTYQIGPDASKSSQAQTQKK